MANSNLKSIIKARSTSFKMNGNKTITASFSSSTLSDYFYLYVSGGAYQCYNSIQYEDTDSSAVQRTKDQVGWPHSNPYTPGKVIQMQIFAPTTKNYSLNIKLNSAFSYNGSSSSPANSFYRFRIDVDSSSIYDGGWKDGNASPYNQNMIGAISVPSSLKWVDFGTHTVHLTKGIHTILMRFGACHQYNKHAAIAINNMRVSLT